MTPALPVALAFLAAAPGPKLAIVDVDAPDLMLGLGAQVTKALEDEARRQKLAVMSPDEVRGQLSPKQYEELRKCHAGAACAAQLLKPLGVSRAVLGQVAKTERHYLLRLWLVDLAGPDVIADVDRRVLIAARRFMTDVAQAVPPLLRGEREARGTLVVQANVANAQVTLEGEFVGVAPLTLPLKPGKYELKVERKKYLAVQRFVTVDANKTTAQDFRLLLKPGEVPDEDEVPALVKKDAEGTKPERAPVTLSPWTWVSIGTTAIAGGTALGLGLSASTGDKRLRAGFDPDANTYQGTRREALRVQQDALGANIALGVAGAAAAASVVFIVLDATADRPAAVQVAPAAGPAGAGVVIGGSF